MRLDSHLKRRLDDAAYTLADIAATAAQASALLLDTTRGKAMDDVRYGKVRAALDLVVSLGNSAARSHAQHLLNWLDARKVG